MPVTFPADVDRTMKALADGLRKVLGPRLVGVYLGGSAAMGDFAVATSDIDFLVVTDGALSIEESLAVKLLHRDLLRRHPYADRLVGDYAPTHLLVPDGTSAPVPGCERGVFLPKVGELVLSAEAVFLMRRDGLAYFGPPPADVLPEVTAEAVTRAIMDTLMPGPEPVETPEEAASEVLNLVRSAYVLEGGEPTSKTTGALWGLKFLEATWHRVIRAALAIRLGDGTDDDRQMVLDMLPGLDTAIRSRYGLLV